MARRILRLRISIDTEPEIWRLIEIDGALTLADLHDIVQITFGWQDTHLHEFTEHDPAVRGIPRIGALGRAARVWRVPHPDDDYPEWIVPLDEATATVGAVVDSLAGAPLRYQYDFGDSWMHRVDLIEDIDDDPTAPTALVIRGSRRGPFANSGGTFGYDEMVDVLADTTHPEHEHVAGWARYVAGPWQHIDPEVFDVDHANRALSLHFGETRSPVPAGSPLGRLLGRMPVSAQREIRALSITAPETHAPSTPLGILLDLAHDPGLELTEAGWLRPASVEQIMTATGWAETWIGKGNREDLTPPVANLRDAAMRLKLLRKFKGRLLLSRAGNAARTSPAALHSAVAESFTTLGRAQSVHDATTLLLLEIARGTPAAERGAAVAQGLEILGYATHSGDPLDADVVHAMLAEVMRVMDATGISPEVLAHAAVRSP